jgi:hypothetical protein
VRGQVHRDAGEALVSASLSEREKNQLASLLRRIIRTVEEGD